MGLLRLSCSNTWACLIRGSPGNRYEKTCHFVSDHKAGRPGQGPAWPHLQTWCMVSDSSFCSRVIICVSYAIAHCICELIPFSLLDGYLRFMLMCIYDVKSIPAQMAGFHYRIHQPACAWEKVPADTCIGCFAYQFTLNCRGPKTLRAEQSWQVLSASSWRKKRMQTSGVDTYGENQEACWALR